jgi:hypothetical protein
MRATQLWYRKLLKDSDNDAFKREYKNWMDLKNRKVTMPTEYSRTSEII